MAAGNFWSLFALIIPGIILWHLSADPDVKRTFEIGQKATAQSVRR